MSDRIRKLGIFLSVFLARNLEANTIENNISLFSGLDIKHNRFIVTVDPFQDPAINLCFKIILGKIMLIRFF